MACKNILDILKQELDFVQKGGYRSAIGWRPPFVFEDSPMCRQTTVGGLFKQQLYFDGLRSPGLPRRTDPMSAHPVE